MVDHQDALLDSWPVAFDQGPASVGEQHPRLSKDEILADLDRLIERRRLFGAELNPTVIKKSGKGSRFLISKVPSKAKMLRLWAALFQNATSPSALLEALSARTHEFEHRDNMLLFGKDRVLYD